MADNEDFPEHEPDASVAMLLLVRSQPSDTPNTGSRITDDDGEYVHFDTWSAAFAYIRGAASRRIKWFVIGEQPSDR